MYQLKPMTLVTCTRRRYPTYFTYRSVNYKRETKKSSSPKISNLQIMSNYEKGSPLGISI